MLSRSTVGRSIRWSAVALLAVWMWQPLPAHTAGEEEDPPEEPPPPPPPPPN